MFACSAPSITTIASLLVTNAVCASSDEDHDALMTLYRSWRT
jgi:hypothetical protein